MRVERIKQAITPYSGLQALSRIIKSRAHAHHLEQNKPLVTRESENAKFLTGSSGQRISWPIKDLLSLGNVLTSVSKKMADQRNSFSECSRGRCR